MRRLYHGKKYKEYRRKRGHEQKYLKNSKTLVVCSIDGLEYEVLIESMKRLYDMFTNILTKVKESYRFGWGEKKQRKLDDSMKLDELRDRVNCLTKDCHQLMIKALERVKSMGLGSKIDHRSIDKHFEETVFIDFSSKTVKLCLEMSRKSFQKSLGIDTQQVIYLYPLYQLVG